MVVTFAALGCVEFKWDAQPSPTPTAISTPTPEPPMGDIPWPDRDCSHFRTWREAQDFYIANGGPKRDPHYLDADRDGIACETLRYR